MSSIDNTLFKDNINPKLYQHLSSFEKLSLRGTNYLVKNLDLVNISDSKIRIGKYGLVGSNKLEGINNLENTKITTIGERAFKDCINVVNINLSKIENLEREAFINCSKLQSSINLNNCI